MAALNRATSAPSISTVPAGATWPFVTLVVGKDTTVFQMGHISKIAYKSEATVSLSRYGYIFFNSKDPDCSFGFSTFKIETVLEALKKNGYKLDKTCSLRLNFAKRSLIAYWIIILCLALAITILGVLKPNGI